MFISVEGLHGAGKTETAALLAARLDAELWPTIPPGWEMARRRVDASDDVNERMSFYLSAVESTSKRISRRLASGASVVVESWWYRTIAFHAGMGAIGPYPNMAERALVPDRAYLLEACAAVRSERRRARGPRRPWEQRADRCEHLILAHYRSYGLTPVHTDSLTIAEVVERLEREACRV